MTMPKGRVETLADGVFAIAMTLLAFNLQPPNVPAIGGASDLQAALLAMLPHFRTYVLSFVVIGIYWLSHHFQFHYVRHADRTLLWINILFLMFVATLPFSTAVLGRYGKYQTAIVLYSANLLLVGMTNAIHWHTLPTGAGWSRPTCPTRLCASSWRGFCSLPWLRLYASPFPTSTWNGPRISTTRSWLRTCCCRGRPKRSREVIRFENSALHVTHSGDPDSAALDLRRSAGAGMAGLRR